MTVLFDGNVLVAITFQSHVHHDAVHAWWASAPAVRFATCPITQGTLLRLALREGATSGGRPVTCFATGVPARTTTSGPTTCRTNR